MSTLKPCPFCGGLPTTRFRITSFGANSDTVEFSVVCSVCGTSKSVRLKTNKECYFSTVEEAIEKACTLWNTRAKP